MAEDVRVTDFVRQSGVDEGAAISGMGQFVKVTDVVRQHGVDVGAALGQLPPEAQANLLKGYCDKLEQKASEIVAAVNKASSGSSLSASQKQQVVQDARKALHGLKSEWSRCRGRLKAIINHFKQSGNLDKFGLADVDAKVQKEEKVAACRARLRAIQAAACKGQ